VKLVQAETVEKSFKKREKAEFTRKQSRLYQVSAIFSFYTSAQRRSERGAQGTRPLLPIECCFALLRTNNEQDSDFLDEF